MTLFLHTPRRSYEISDLYLMALAFLITYWATKISMNAINRLLKKEKTVDLNGIRGGELKIEFSDETKLGLTILACIEDNENYLVIDPKIKKLIFNLVKKKIKQESLVLTPNFIRFLSFKFINLNQTLLVRIGNLIVSSDNRARLIARLIRSTTIAFGSAISVTFSYGIILAIIYFSETQNCGYKCYKYFEKLLPNKPIEIYADRPNGNLVISGDDDARQIATYILSESKKKVIETNKETGEKIIRTASKYIQVRKKAKEVKFSEFRQSDPVLSLFDKLDEPKISTNYCGIRPNDIRYIIDVSIK